MPLEVVQIPILTDNYTFLAHDTATKKTAVIDPGEVTPVIETLATRGWSLDYILNTHHHWDHTDGNLALKEATGCQIVGPERDKNRIPGIDQTVDEGDTFALGSCSAKVWFIPGHTRGHILYWFAEDEVVFLGDTLFAMGCGYLFEGSPEQMWDSLARIRDLPEETLVYCAHEYTAQNAAFAMTVESTNEDLIARRQQVIDLRAQNRPTIPTNIGIERLTNPFLRPDSAIIRQNLSLDSTVADAEVFATLRAQKDRFR